MPTQRRVCVWGGTWQIVCMSVNRHVFVKSTCAHMHECSVRWHVWAHKHMCCCMTVLYPWICIYTNGYSYIWEELICVPAYALVHVCLCMHGCVCQHREEGKESKYGKIPSVRERIGGMYSTHRWCDTRWLWMRRKPFSLLLTDVLSLLVWLRERHSFSAIMLPVSRPDIPLLGTVCFQFFPDTAIVPEHW